MIANRQRCSSGIDNLAQSISMVILICDQDDASVIMRAVLGTCPLLFLAGHFLVSSCAPTGALLAAALVADLSANALSSSI